MGDKPLSCKLTSPELRKRKETVIASLKKQVLERKELPNGYAYKFTDTDAVLDELTEFIKLLQSASPRSISTRYFLPESSAR